jgi:phosphoglycerate dehydrogenase-like enzyme
MGKKVLCLWDLTEEQKTSLVAAGGGLCDFTFTSIKKVTKEQANHAEIIFGNINADLIRDSSCLKWLQLNSAGTDQYIASRKLPSSVKLTNATGAYGQSVAEHMFAVMLMLMKNLHLYRDNQSNAVWSDWGTVTTPENSRILINGLGDIGNYFASLCKKFGAYTIGLKRHISPKPEFIDELYTGEKLDEILPSADVIVSILPNTKETAGLWDIQKFSLMKKSAFFINAGRGNAVKQEDLYTALKKQIIAGAGIDVTVPEPLPPDSKLWTVPNLILTPHIAGEFHLAATFIRILEIARKNLILYLEDKPLINEVDFSTGYRKSV